MYILYKNIDIFQNEIKYILYKCDEGGGQEKSILLHKLKNFQKRKNEKVFLFPSYLLSYQETFPGSLVSHKTSIRQQAFPSKL